MSWLFPGGTTIVGSPVTIGTTTVLPPGSNASVTNTGTAYAPVLNFGIPTVANVEGTITGAASTVVISDLAANIVAVSDASGKFANSTITTTKLGYLGDVTSNIQAQLGTKQATITGAASTVVTSNLAANIVVVTDASGKLSNNAITTTTLGYLGDVTSNIQAQINSKQAAYSTLVYVSSVSDLPAANAGVITLADDTVYRFVSNVDLAGSRFKMGHNTALVGTPFAAKVSSSGLYFASPLIEATRDYCLDGMEFNAPTVLDTIVSNTSIVSIRQCAFQANVAGGTIGGGSMITVDSCNWNGTTGTGPLTIAGTTPLMYVTNSRFKGFANSSSIQIASNVVSLNRIYISSCDFDSTTTTGIVVSNAAVLGQDGLWINGCVFLSNTAVSGVDTTTSTGVFSWANKNLMSSRATGVVYITTPATILTANTATYYKLAGNYAASPINSKFSPDGAGRLTFSGSIPDKFMVSASLSVLSTRKLDVCSFGIYNSATGNVAPESIQTVTTDTVIPVNVTLLGVAALSNTQYLEVWGKNATTPNGNIIVNNCTLSVVGT